MRRLKPQSVPLNEPFALVESSARGVAITAANAAAMATGIHAGQMLADARAVFPGLLTSAAEPKRDTLALTQLALWLGRYGPCRNVDGQDALWVDMTGVAHLFGGEEALAQDCIKRLRYAGYHALLAIADTRSAAFALCRYGLMNQQVLIAPPGEVRASLAGLPVEGLQLTADLVVLLRRLGLKRIGQLYHLPRAALARRFRDSTPKKKSGTHKSRSYKSASIYAGSAEALVMRLDQALGELSEPARGIAEPPVYRVQRAYPEPLISHEGIFAALEDLAVRLCAVLEQKDEGARALLFAICRADGTIIQVPVRTSRPARESTHIVELFRARLESVDAGLGIDALVLEAMQTECLLHEQKGFAGAGSLRRDTGRVDAGGADVGVLIDRLTNRLGSKAVFYLADVESHIPERAQQRIPALSNCVPVAAHREQRAGRETIKRPRPVFLLEPAEPISVIAAVPDGPPARFTWRRIARRVIRSEGPERLAPEWWRLFTHAGLPGGEKPKYRMRDYYRVEDEHGGCYWIYRAGLYPNEQPDIQQDTQPDKAESLTSASTSSASAKPGRELDNRPTAAPPDWYLQGLF